jgi:hypothetical protein
MKINFKCSNCQPFAIHLTAEKPLRNSKYKLAVSTQRRKKFQFLILPAAAMCTYFPRFISHISNQTEQQQQRQKRERKKEREKNVSESGESVQARQPTTTTSTSQKFLSKPPEP